MDVRQLKYFLEVARVSNFTKAAEALRIAQPAISMAIRKLEQELELVLFNRQDKKVSLTAEGEIFLPHARRVIDDLKAAEQEMGELRGLMRHRGAAGVLQGGVLHQGVFPRGAEGDRGRAEHRF